MTDRVAGERRVVAYTGENGKSLLLDSDAAPAVVRYRALPGMQTSVLWATEANASLDKTASEDPVPDLASVHPGPGESLFMTLTLPPDSIFADPAFDPLAAATEHARHAPGLAERMEPAAPGFHRTETIDYVIVLDGEVILEVDTGMSTLSVGDCVVQIGSRHAWRNASARPATLGVVMIGAHRPS